MEIENNLPFDPSSFRTGTETVGTVVHFPREDNDQVIKVSKRQEVTTSLIDAIQRVKDLREREEVALKSASEITKAAIVPQEYVLASGDDIGTNRIVRTQKYVEGPSFKKIGFAGIMSMDDEHKAALKSILKDSMKCFIEHGTNYDLFGSDERDANGKSRVLNIKRLIFPLRNSSNLIYTKDGIKLVDPNVLSTPDKPTIKSLALQSILFASSAFNYLMLDVSQKIPGADRKTSQHPVQV